MNLSTNRILTRRAAWLAPYLLTLTALTSVACNDETTLDDGKGGAGGDANEEAPATGDEPLYAMMIQVYSQDDRDVYVHLTKDLDVSDIDLSKDREFPGVANFAGIDGRILVSSGMAPEILEFGISNDLEWVDGRTVSFSSYPLDDNANFYAQFILNSKTAYMPFDSSKRLIWNPADMTIEGTREESSLEVNDAEGRLLIPGGNRNGIRYEGPVQQAFFYVDDTWFDYGPESVVVTYDPKTHEEKDHITIPCPALSMPSQDEDGYTYYGTWSFMDRALFGDGPDPCIARLKPDLTLDTEWTTNLEDITDGRAHNNFRYIGGGRAIANVLHTEELQDANFDDGFDQDLVDAIYKSGPHWKLWLIDLEAKTGAPVEGIDVDIASGAQFAVLDGRTFVFLPYEDWARTKIYEIGDDGVATERGDTTGDVFKWVRIR